MSSLALTYVLAAKARLIQKLLEGDAVAWSVVAAAVGIFAVISAFKYSRRKNPADSGRDSNGGDTGGR